MLQNFVTQNGIKALIREWKFLCVTGDIDLGMWRDIKADIAGDMAKQFAIGTTTASDVKQAALRVMRILSHRSKKKAPGQMKRIRPAQSPRSSRHTPDRRSDFMRSAQIPSHTYVLVIECSPVTETKS